MTDPLYLWHVTFDSVYETTSTGCDSVRIPYNNVTNYVVTTEQTIDAVKDEIEANLEYGESLTYLHEAKWLGKMLSCCDPNEDNKTTIKQIRYLSD